MLQGLANLGNTCSINTLIQCLGHCPSLLEFMLHTEIPIHKKEQRRYSIYQELKQIFHQMWVEHHSLAPHRFLKAFYESLGDMYAPGEQFDFTEMWMLLLHNLIEETHSPNYVSNHQFLGTYELPILSYLEGRAQENWKRFFQHTNSPLNDILYGMEIQQVECTSCQHICHNLEPTAFHYIEIQHGSHMAHGLQKLLSQEPMNGWKCDKCHKETGVRAIRFWKLPQIWIIILKRFNQSHKMIDPLDISQEFTVEKGLEFCSLPNSEVPSITYELKAMANHYGSLHGGHYNAICKNKDGSWYEYDDLGISKVGNIEALLTQNRNAYVLFYERRN